MVRRASHKKSRICNGCPIMPVTKRRDRCSFILFSKVGFVRGCGLGLWKKTGRGSLKCQYGDVDVLQLEKVLKTVEDDRTREILLQYLSRMGREAEMGTLQIKA